MAMMDALMGMTEETETPAGSSNTIALPQGFSAPDEVQDGQEFEVVAKVMIHGGQLMFSEINGVKIPGEHPEEDEAEEEVEEEEVETQTEAEPAKEMTLKEAARASGYTR